MESKAASIWIGIFNTKNLRVEPPVLDLRTTYTFQVAVINHTTTSGGHPWQANFEVGVGISLDGVDIVPYTIQPPRQFAPDETIKYTSTAYIQSKWAGMSGLVTAKALDPFGALLASGQKRFTIGYEVSPEAIYEVPGGELEGIDMPYLNPELDNQEGVVIGGVGSRPPPPPPPRPAPKIDYSKSKPPPGLDSSSTPEPPMEFEGEVVVDGRIG